MESTKHIQDHIDTTAVPGTIHLVDVEGTIRTEHGEGRLADVVLHPKPSSNPDDPLNWSKKRKLLSTVALGMYTLMIAIASAAIYSVLIPISMETGLSLADLNAGTGYMFLALGWGCLITQPLALQYGKRPVYLFSLFATMAVMLWVPHATTNAQWIGSKVLQGLFMAPIESLPEISISDVYFSHERGTYLGLYGFLLAGGSFFSAVIAGFINDGQNWQWVMYWCAIFLGIAFVFCFFFLEETNFDRPRVEGEIISESPSPASTTSISEKTSDDPERAAGKTATRLNIVSSGTAEVDYEPKTYLQKLAILDKKCPFHLFQMMLWPFRFFSFPAVVYAGFSYGSALVWFNVLNGTAGLILAFPPYSFSSTLIGTAYTSPIIGVAIGSIWSGFVGDRLTLWLARRNKGVREPEHRLWMFTPSLLLIPGALLLWGVGAAHQVHWFGLIFAMGCIAVTNAIAVQVSVSYCIDSYKDLSTHAMVTVILIRNTMSFAINYGLTPWVVNMGLQNAFILAACVGFAQVCTFFAVVKYGKEWRNSTKERYYRYVAQCREMGLAH